MNYQKVEFKLSAAKSNQFPRDGVPQIAFAGKSNVGKSSVINRVLQRKNLAYVGSSPGKTIHINYFLVDNTAYLVDLPGYGYAKVSRSEKERWGKLMESYFALPELITLGILIGGCPPCSPPRTISPWQRGSSRRDAPLSWWPIS